MFLEPALKLTAEAEGAPASWRSGFPSDLGEQAAASRAARSRPADRRRGLPRERAIGTVRLARGGRGGNAWEEMQERQAGVGWKQSPDALNPGGPILFLHPWFAMGLRP